MDNRQQQAQSYQPVTYDQIGFNPFFERSPRTYNASDSMNNLVSPFIESVVDNAILYDPFSDTMSQNNTQSSQSISADQVQGGTLTSNNGNLSVDLTSGTITYSDGVQSLLNVGGTNNQGTPNSLTITNSQGQNIVSS